MKKYLNYNNEVEDAYIIEIKDRRKDQSGYIYRVDIDIIQKLYESLRISNYDYSAIIPIRAFGFDLLINISLARNSLRRIDENVSELRYFEGEPIFLVQIKKGKYFAHCWISENGDIAFEDKEKPRWLLIQNFLELKYDPMRKDSFERIRSFVMYVFENTNVENLYNKQTNKTYDRTNPDLNIYPFAFYFLNGKKRSPEQWDKICRYVKDSRIIEFLKCNPDISLKFTNRKEWEKVFEELVANMRNRRIKK